MTATLAIAEISKTCRKCGGQFSGFRCKACDKAYKAANAERMREKTNARKRAYRAKNPSNDKEYKAAYYAANKKKFRAINEAWSKANIDKVRVWKAEWRAKNVARVREARTNWEKENPEKRREYRQNRRARKLNHGGRLSTGLVAKLLHLQKGRCACCQKKLGTDYHLDHVIPLARGGANEDWNMQLLKSGCNLKKGSKHPIDFMQTKGYLL